MNQPQPMVRIVINAAMLGGASAEDTSVRGAVLVALVDSLKRAGRPVEVWVAFHSEACRGKGHCTYMVPVLKAGQPLSIPRLDFAIGHAASFRRLCFAVRETEAMATVRAMEIFANGYGRTADLPSHIKAFADVYFESISRDPLAHKLADPKRAAEWLADTLRGLGVELTGAR